MKSKNKSAKKLSKSQLKKLKGGLLTCTRTNCVEQTCGLAAESKNVARCRDQAGTLNMPVNDSDPAVKEK